MVALTTVYLFLLFQFSYALNNGLGRTPQMGSRKILFFNQSSYTFSYVIGWNSWNHFGCGINEEIVRQTADAMVATGLAAVGYQYGIQFI